jgi:3'-phosphoadenosine 5'-phosphosulfate sulfotransferase (PAPS reductase)/FAD synthetase
MKKYISFSGGVESTTMCLLYGKGASAIWCDTGAEHKEMYNRIDKVEQYLKEFHKGDFNLIRIGGGKLYKKQLYTSLEDLIVACKVMPSQQMRFCTNYFKAAPIDKYLKEQGDCELMIGFNYDEQGRTGSLEAMPNVKYTYPLIEDGLDRNDCEEILTKNGMHPNFPVYMLRGGCRMCFFKSEKEYRAMYHLNQFEFMEMVEFEEKIQDKRKKFYSIMGNGKRLRDLMLECQREKLMFPDIEKLYKSLKKETSCGAFCHR